MSRISHDWKSAPVWVPTLGKLLFLCFLSMAPVEAKVLEAQEKTASDLETTRTEMEVQRERIATERAEWTRELDALQADVRDLRVEWREIQRAITLRESERATMRRRAESIDSEHRSMRAALTEFRRGVETRMSAAQLQRHGEILEEIDTALASDEEATTTLGALSPTLELLRAVVVDDLPSRSFPGYALDERGRVLKGRFVRAGPTTLFIDEAGTRGGVAMTDPVGEALLFDELREREARHIREWFEGSRDTAPVDVSGGALLRIADARISIWERMLQGGVVMIPLVIVGAACLVVAIWRYIALRRMEIDIDPILTRILERLRAGDRAGARTEAEQVVAPWRDVLVDAVDHVGADRAYLEEILQDRIVMQGPKVSQHLGALAISAAAAPLLGLLGTVTGMIHTFQLITVFGTGDARSLSGGISEALITTQFGLIIAVPALLAHAYLARRAKGLMAGLEQAAIRFVRNGSTTEAERDEA